MNVVKDEVQDWCSLRIFVDYFGRARRQRSIGQPKLGARIETFIRCSVKQTYFGNPQILVFHEFFVATQLQNPTPI